MKTESSNSSSTEKLLLVFGLISSLLTAVVLSALVPQFANVFQSFGAELPFLTKSLVEFYRAFFLLPIFVVLAWYLAPKHSRGIMSFLTGMFCLFGITGISVVLLYLPIFMLGNTV